MKGKAWQRKHRLQSKIWRSRKTGGSGTTASVTVSWCARRCVSAAGRTALTGESARDAPCSRKAGQRKDRCCFSSDAQDQVLLLNYGRVSSTRTYTPVERGSVDDRGTMLPKKHPLVEAGIYQHNLTTVRYA